MPQDTQCPKCTQSTLKTAKGLGDQRSFFIVCSACGYQVSLQDEGWQVLKDELKRPAGPAKKSKD